MTKIERYREQSIEDFSKPIRVYSDSELRDFHDKIQKFWEEPREVDLPGGMGGTAQRFAHQRLHVALGAAKEVKHGNTTVHLYNDRYKDVFVNLWSQYEDWKRKQDWIADKRAEELAGLDHQVPF